MSDQRTFMELVQVKLPDGRIKEQKVTMRAVRRRLVSIACCSDANRQTVAFAIDDVGCAWEFSEDYHGQKDWKQLPDLPPRKEREPTY